MLEISKNLNTRLPPSRMKWYIQVSSGVMPIVVTTMANGRTKPKLMITSSVWYINRVADEGGSVGNSTTRRRCSKQYNE